MFINENMNNLYSIAKTADKIAQPSDNSGSKTGDAIADPSAFIGQILGDPSALKIFRQIADAGTAVADKLLPSLHLQLDSTGPGSTDDATRTKGITDLTQQLKAHGWNGDTTHPFAKTVGKGKDQSTYVVGNHGEIYIQSATGEMLATSDQSNATIIKRDAKGNIEGSTPQFNFSSQIINGVHVLNLSKKGDSTSDSITIEAQGNGFEVTYTNDLNQTLSLNVQTPDDAKRFNLLFKMFLAGSETEAELFDDFKLSAVQFNKKFPQASSMALAAIGIPSAADPLGLILGDGLTPPTAVITGADGNPVVVDLKTGNVGIDGLNSLLDTIFYSDPSLATTFGTQIDSALRLERLLSSGRSGSHENDAAIIDAAVGFAQTAIYLAEQGDMSQLPMLQDIYYMLGAIGTIAASLAQSSVSGAIQASTSNSALLEPVLKKNAAWNTPSMVAELLHNKDQAYLALTDIYQTA